MQLGIVEMEAASAPNLHELQRIAADAVLSAISPASSRLIATDPRDATPTSSSKQSVGRAADLATAPPLSSAGRTLAHARAERRSTMRTIANRQVTVYFATAADDDDLAPVAVQQGTNIYASIESSRQLDPKEWELQTLDGDAYGRDCMHENIKAVKRTARATTAPVGRTG